jgi:hypothetical protein
MPLYRAARRVREARRVKEKALRVFGRLSSHLRISALFTA